jgi:hypothetical protein
MHSDIFPLVDCKPITIHTFLLQFGAIINEVVPQKIIKKYIDTPIGCITTSMEEISDKLLQYYTVEDMHKAFMELSESEQHFVVSELDIMYIEFGSVPNDSLVLVPDDPKDYIKPFFAEKLNLQDLLIN